MATNQGLLQAQIKVKNTIDLNNAFSSPSVANPQLKSIEGDLNLSNEYALQSFNSSNTNTQHIDTIRTNSDNTSLKEALNNLPNLKYVRLEGNYESKGNSFDNNTNLQKVDLSESLQVKPEDFKENENLRTLPNLDYSNPDLTDIITNDTNLLPTTFDISNEPNTNKLGIHGDSTHQLGNLEFVKVNPEAPFDNQITPQINVSYTSLNQNGLVNLFNTMPYNVGYTVVGSPTINNGIASNFSSNDYILINNSFSTTRDWSLEIAFTFATPTSNVYLTAIGDTFQLGLLNNGTNQIFLNINGAEHISGPVDFTVGNKYFVKVSYSNGKYIVYFKEDNGLDYSVLYTVTAGAVTSSTITIGMYNNIGFNSNIDLNNTIITIDSQVSTGPVGYTVNGSPTIVDGVASGFSSSDYLNISSGASSNSLEVVISLKDIPQIVNNLGCILRLSGDLTLTVFHQTNGTVRVYYTGFDGNSKYISAFDYANDGTFKIVISSTGVETYYSSDGSSYSAVSSLSVQPYSISFTSATWGYLSSTLSAFQGSIDLNETYIKVNGKLWFGHESKQVTWFNGKSSQLKVVDVSGATGASSLTDDDKAIVTNKGWSLVTGGG